MGTGIVHVVKGADACLDLSRPLTQIGCLFVINGTPCSSYMFSSYMFSYFFKKRFIMNLYNSTPFHVVKGFLANVLFKDYI